MSTAAPRFVPLRVRASCGLLSPVSALPPARSLRGCGRYRIASLLSGLLLIFLALGALETSLDSIFALSPRSNPCLFLLVAVWLPCRLHYPYPRGARCASLLPCWGSSADLGLLHNRKQRCTVVTAVLIPKPAR